MGFDDPDGLTEQIDMQIEAGLATAGVVVFVVDIRTGRVPADGKLLGLATIWRKCSSRS